MDKTSQISLKQLLSLVKKGIESAHPFSYWVVAEISEIKVNYSGHCYLELIEKPEGQNTPIATTRAVIWRSKYSLIAPYFRSVTSIDMAAGMKVLVRATVQYSELYGFSLQISDIDPTYTMGDNERQKRETIERLKQDGVYEMNKECFVPEFISRIAVISSKNAAGFEDFMRELDSRWNFEVKVFESLVQGAAAEDSIINALDLLAEEYEDFDAVVIIRGGGSQSDLGCFDSYRLCSYIAQFPLPIITGIGHNKDVSVADMVACISLKTPTAVAVFLKDKASEAARLVEELQSQLSALTTAAIDSAKQKIAASSNAINITVNQKIAASRADIQKLSSQLGICTISQTQKQRGRLENYKAAIKSCINFSLANKQNSLENYTNIVKNRSSEIFISQKQRTINIENLIFAHNPQRLLEIGFAIVKTDKGTLKSTKGHRAGESLDIVLKDGVIKTEIKEIWKNQ